MTIRPAIDPTMKAIIDSTPLHFSIEHGVEYARKQLAALTPAPEALPSMRTEDHRIGHGDIADIPVRIYWPPAKGEHDLPMVVFYHGGGWAIGDLDIYDAAARAHAIGAEAIVVSVAYRLAPEHPFPAAIDDSWAALHWVGEHAREFGGDPARIAVAGDSAGGNIAAVMAQMARDNGGPRLVYQLLWYPVTTFDPTLPSMIENANAPSLDSGMLAAYRHWYLPPTFATSDPQSLPSTLAPANVEDMSGLPDAYIATAEHDPIRDHGVQYAERLLAAGVSVELHNAPNLTHGYMTFAGAVPAAAHATNLGLTALKDRAPPVMTRQRLAAMLWKRRRGHYVMDIKLRTSAFGVLRSPRAADRRIPHFVCAWTSPPRESLSRHDHSSGRLSCFDEMGWDDEVFTAQPLEQARNLRWLAGHRHAAAVD